MSDLHLEINSPDYIKSLSDLVSEEVDTSDKILILAGDIGYPWRGDYWDFLNECAKRYKHVLFVLGNHEFYALYDNQNMTMREIIEMIEKKEKQNNLHFLNNSKLTIDGITFLGTTLWTNIPEEYGYEIYSSMNDYEYILHSRFKNDKIKLSIDDVNFEHKVSKKWLEEEITNTNEPIVVITHHMPLFKLIDKKYEQYKKLNYAFASNMSYLLSPKIKYWFCGHTHSSNDYTHDNGTRFVINPFGYEDENKKFSLTELEV